MTDIDVETIQKEEQAMNDALKGKYPPPAKKSQDEAGDIWVDPFSERQVGLITRLLKGILETVDLKIGNRLNIEFPAEQTVKGKVSIVDEVKAKIGNWPPVQKIMGKVEAIVKFPDIQKITGRVKADVEFPAVQKVEGKVEVRFPDVQTVTFKQEKAYKIQGDVKTDVPKMEAGNIEVVPVVFWDGKRIVNPFSQQVSGNGKLYAAIQELTAATQTQSVFYSAQVMVTVSGSVLSLGTASIKTISVQALKSNRGLIYISASGANDYELQPGQPVTIVINNLSKVKVVGSYINDGVCYIAS